MGDDRSRRVESALSALIESLITRVNDEDDASLDERRDDALALATSIIDRNPIPSTEPDANHVADLIKKTLLHNNDSRPDEASRISNLLSRLLAQPVLSQKSAILLLLYQLAEGRLLDADRSELNDSHPKHNLLSQSKDRIVDGQRQIRMVEDAFSPIGLPRLTSRDDRTRRERASVGNGVQRHRSQQDPMPKIVDMSQDEKLDATDSSTPSETLLLHDLPFTLQGLSSTHLAFTAPSSLDLPSTLPLPMLSLLNTLAEPSLLYRSLSDFVESRDKGLVGQSLRSAVGIELRSYLGLIATLEGEIRRAIASANPKESRGGIAKKGGQIITMIHSFSSSHGDPFVAAFAERMLIQVTRPFYDMLRQWIYDGELSDPYHEFFVHEQRSSRDVSNQADPRRAPATSVWEDKYKLEENMVPSIINDDFARKIFLIGKSLNFIRYSCGDSEWVEGYCKDASRELHYGDTATLEISIDKAYQTTMTRLIDLMDNKFQLFEHLRALKKYLLLGQGDFIALLMESLSANLDRPAGSQYRHTLTAQLEHAIRGSNAQYDSPEVLRRLDARLLELSHGEIGWDVFTLEYKVDAPVDVVITAWASKQYLVVFNFLWRIKRVEFALGSTWRRCMTGARGVLATVDGESSRDWKRARCCIAEMIHFVNQLQYYILFEVIEASWNHLQTAITKPGATLDDLVEAHTTYLKAITHKGLLGSARSGLTGSREDSFTSQLHHILKTMLAYKDVVDGLYSFCVAEFTRDQEKSARFETQKSRNLGTDDSDFRSPSPNPASLLVAQNLLAPATSTNNNSRADSPFPISTGALAVTTQGDSILPALRQRLGDLSKDFTSKVNVLLGDLMVQPDADMKFLGTVMNFNDVYTPKKRRRERAGKTPGTVREKEAGKEKGKQTSKDEEGKQRVQEEKSGA